jgi:hypothetical protein
MSATLVGRDQPGAERAEGRAALALGPLTAALGLELALRDVVADAEAGDRRHGVLLGDIGAAIADHDRELDFPIGLHRVLRDLDVVIGADDAVRRLVEQDRLCRDRGAGLGGVIGEVQPDRDEVADVADAGADSRRTLHERERFRIQRLELGERGRGQRLAGEIRKPCLTGRAARPWHPAAPASLGRVHHNEPTSRRFSHFNRFCSGGAILCGRPERGKPVPVHGPDAWSKPSCWITEAERPIQTFLAQVCLPCRIARTQASRAAAIVAGMQRQDRNRFSKLISGAHVHCAASAQKPR